MVLGNTQYSYIVKIIVFVKKKMLRNHNKFHYVYYIGESRKRLKNTYWF